MDKLDDLSLKAIWRSLQSARDRHPRLERTIRNVSDKVVRYSLMSRRQRWDLLMSRLPVTRQYRTRHIIRIRERARTRIVEFANLKSLDSDAKTILLPSMRHQLIIMAEASLWLDVVDGLTALLYFVTTLGTTAIVFVAISNLIEPNLVKEFFSNLFDFSTSFQRLTLALPIILAALPILVRLILKPRFASFLIPNWVFTVWLWGVTAIYLIAVVPTLANSAYPSDLDSRYLLIGMATTASMTPAAFFSITAMFAIRLRYRKRTFKVYPIAAVVDRLLSVLSLTEHFPGNRGQMHFQRRLMSNLEDAALTIELYFPQYYRASDLATDQAQTQAAQQMATAMRGLKAWLFTPKSDTREHFISRVAHDLTNAARSSWDEMERVEFDTTIDSRTLRLQVLAFLRGLLIGMLPAIGLLLVQSSPALALSDPVAEYAKVGVLLWALLSIFAALDPLFGTKLSALKDITSLLPLPGKGKSNTP